MWNQLIKVGLLVKMVNARDPAMSEFEELTALGNMESPPRVVWLVSDSESETESEDEDETSRVEGFLVPGVEMVFPRPLEVADDLIPLYVEPREFELVVVSSDGEEEDDIVPGVLQIEEELSELLLVMYSMFDMFED